MTNMQYVCMCGLKTNYFLFYLSPEPVRWPPLKQYVQVLSPIFPHNIEA